METDYILFIYYYNSYIFSNIYNLFYTHLFIHSNIIFIHII